MKKGAKVIAGKAVALNSRVFVYEGDGRQRQQKAQTLVLKV